MFNNVAMLLVLSSLHFASRKFLGAIVSKIVGSSTCVIEFGMFYPSRNAPRFYCGTVCARF